METTNCAFLFSFFMIYNSIIMEYAITARKTRKPVTKEHYFDYMDYLTDIGKVGNVYFETTKGLHTHFILQTKDKLDYKRLKPTKYGWNVKAIPIYNRKGWIKYSRKDMKDNEALNKCIPTPYGSKDKFDDEFIDDADCCPFNKEQTKMLSKNIFKAVRSKMKK